MGSSWRSRWDSLRLFSPAQYDALPGMAFPAPADTYPGKEAVADFLRDYTTRFDLPVQLGKQVTELSRVGDEFHVRTDDQVFRAQQVLVATGPFQSPFTPDAGHGFDDSVTQIHSTRYRNPQSLPPGPVLVVGGGNSGLQIAHELVATRQVDVSVGEKVPMLPQRVLGRDLFWWLTRLGFMRVNTATRLGRRLRARGEFVIGTNRRRLKQAGVRFRPRLVNARGQTARFADEAPSTFPSWSGPPATGPTTHGFPSPGSWSIAMWRTDGALPTYPDCTSSACPGSTPAGPHCSGSSRTTRRTLRSGLPPRPLDKPRSRLRPSRPLRVPPPDPCPLAKNVFDRPARDAGSEK
jgi:cation diffusion facilitator CzcD-associated flavoprotein CzcO